MEGRIRSSSRFNPLIHVLKVVAHPTPKQTNKWMWSHEHVSADADTETGCAAAIYDENFVYFGNCEQIDASVGIERYEINRRV